MSDVAVRPPDPDDEDQLTDIPEELRFDVAEREDPEETDRIPFALDGRRLYARRPKDYTMLALASAMSGMADGPDVAYCVMLFCHDSFDGHTRQAITRLEDTELYALITALCDKWGEDTSSWKKRGTNRAARRSVKGRRK